MGNIYFDNRKELVVWGIIWILLGIITNILMENSDYGFIGIISFFYGLDLANMVQNLYCLYFIEIKFIGKIKTHLI